MMKKKNKNNIKILILYVLILFLSISGFIYIVNATTNQEQIVNTGGITESEDGVTISKTISETDTENFFDITLTVETNSQIKNITTYPDLAVVIVMDISNTMVTEKVKDGSFRYDAAIAASETFINSFKTESDKSLAKREIGFVAFNTDAHRIFSLQTCTTASCSENNVDLITKMKSSTSSIVRASGYGSSEKRFTNIEGGLKMAHDMLNKSSASNKYIIFISDGMPTTYLKNTTNYEGYSPYNTSGAKISSEGVFAYTPKQYPCTHGTSYSDRGAIKARIEATSIKQDKINIMAVGTGINSDSFQTIQDYLNHAGGNKDGFSVVDSEVSTGFEIGSDSDKSSYVNWLKTKIASNNQYYNSDDSSLTATFQEIFKSIEEQLKSSTEASWVANDPMGALIGNEKIEFIGFYDDNNILQNSLSDYKKDGTDDTTQSDTASFDTTSSAINWDLKKSSYHETRTETTNGTTLTYYKYILKYRVRLKNEINDFDELTIYKTNGTTSLTYMVLKNNGTLSETKTLYFKEPSVKGYLGELKLYKVSSFDNITKLTGAKFKLVHDPNCKCENGYLNFSSNTQHVHINTEYATSNANGEIIFENIPSGHTYILSEDEAPSDFNSTKETYTIEVAYDKTTGGPSNGLIKNTPKTGTLEIKKIVEGTDYKGTFSFDLTLYYNNSYLTGTYNYTLNGTEKGTIVLNDLNKGKTIVKLGSGDKLVIEKLPVGTTYTITETTTNGFKVQYKINSSNEVIGNKTSCNALTNCRIESGNTNIVEFINTAGYILPETGSHGTLILIITSLVFILVPVINIAYTFFKEKRKIS